MPQYEDVLTLSYDFLKELIPTLAKFPRDQKFLLADRMQSLVHDVLDDFIAAYYTKDKAEKMARLKPVNVKLERLRFAVRLSHDLKLLNNQKYGVISTKINEIGGSLGNWLKYLEGKK